MKAQAFSWEDMPVRWQSENDESPSVGHMKGQLYLCRWQHCCDKLPKATVRLLVILSFEFSIIWCVISIYSIDFGEKKSFIVMTEVF